MKGTFSKYLIAILTVFMVGSAFTLQDQKATKILNDVSKTYKSYKTIKAKFTIDVINKQNSGSSFSQSGTLYLKGKKFRIDMNDQEIYCDGKKLYTYFKGAGQNECQITDYNPDDQDINPSEIFTLYQKGFAYRFIGETMKNGKKIANIELTPDDKNKPYYKVKLNVDQAAHKIVDMTVLNKNGLESTYAITAFSPNIAISDSFFKFNEKDHPGVVVIDLTKAK